MCNYTGFPSGVCKIHYSRRRTASPDFSGYEKKTAAADMLIFTVLLRRLLYDKNHKLVPSVLRQMIFAIRYARKTVEICQISAAAVFLRYTPDVFI